MEKTKEKYYIVRTYSAGVFAGNIVRRNGKISTSFPFLLTIEVEMKDARRIWYWDGASSLSELATYGTVKPEKCKFPGAVPSVVLTEVIEILTCTAEAEKSIRGVPIWSARAKQ